MMVVAATPNHIVAAIISYAFQALWNAFSGFIIPRSRMPIWWGWNYWACPVAWTLYGMITCQWRDITDTLNTGEVVKDYLRRYFGFRHDFLGAVAGVIIGLTAVFAFIFALSIRTFNLQRR